MRHIALQSLLRPALTPVPRCKDYAVFQQTLQNIDRFLNDSELESQAIEMAMEGWEEASRLLSLQDFYDALAPRNVGKMIERMKQPRFVKLQHRRGGTEGRIGTMKNRWQGGRIRTKGYEHRTLAVGWSVLSHILWQISKRLAQEAEQRQVRAA